MKRVSWGLLLVLLLAPFALAQDQTRVIRISLSADGEIEVSPGTLEIDLGDRVSWQITGPRRDEVEIEFAYERGTRGPFRSKDSSDNPSRGRYRKRAGRDVTTGPSDLQGEFKYSVFWLDNDGKMMHLDPIIVVR